MDYQTRAREIEEELADLKDEWLKNECPIKIGDTVVVNGYSNTRKKMIVDRLYLTKGSFIFSGWSWRATGRVLKKDGTAGSLTGEYSIPIEAV